MLHHPFDDEVLETADQRACLRHAGRAGAAGVAARSRLDLLARLPKLAQRDRSLARAGTGRFQRVLDGAQATLTDVYLFGEAGLFGARRGAEDGARARSSPGRMARRATVPGSSIAGEILLTPRATLGLRGPMVPVAAYAPPPPPGDSLIAPPPRDYVDTEYAARLDRATGAINITSPPSGIMAVGGYRFLAQRPAGMGAGGSARARC